MFLLVGLGNPGPKYEGHRHNIGFMAVDQIAQAYNFSPWRKKFQGETCEGQLGSNRVILLKPTTYMNESGRAVAEACRFYKIKPENVFVFHDELDLKPGKVKAKLGGGAAGHNGLRSTGAHIGMDFHRIRMGIGHPGKDRVTQWVLGDFAKADGEWLEPLLDALAKTAPSMLSGDLGRFMTDLNQTLNPAPIRPKAKAKPSESAKGDTGASGKQSKQQDTAQASDAAQKPKTALGDALMQLMNKQKDQG